MSVVPCNYAGLYTGTFSWTSVLDAGSTHYVESVTVTVTNGRAVCNGSVVETGNGQTPNRTVAGAGLFAVEFSGWSNNSYLITAACPTPADAGTPSRPAELGHFEMKSDWQPAKGLGVDLVGKNSYPSPDSDPLNGVTGTVTIGWTLKHS